MTSIALFRRSVRLAIVAACLLGSAAGLADDRPVLRGDVVARRDTLTLGDLIAGVPTGLAETALFRAPSLGQSGTIQAHRIVEAAQGLGVAGVETGGRLQIAVTRAARLVGPAEIETILKRALETQVGLDPRWTGIAFEGASPSLTAAPDIVGEARAGDVLYDRRTRRVTATIWLGPSAGERRVALQVAGTAVELVEVAVVARALDRGEAVKATDITVERRARDTVAVEAVFDGSPLVGRVARRPLATGGLIRAGDLMRAEIVSKGETVTMVYEVPGIMLSMRARASEAGGLGDTISVVNPGSKKAVQAKIVAAGKVSVTPGETQRVVASAATASQR